MIKTKTLVLSTILLLSPLPTFAADTWQKLEFPTAIKTTQTITAKPSGWEASIGENEHQVVGVTVYDGHPDQQASLKRIKRIYKQPPVGSFLLIARFGWGFLLPIQRRCCIKNYLRK
jgi:hypothetical protein